ncbi:aldehyde dehydrogenase family protein, partial [Pauljensenia sp. UMB3104]
REAGVGPERGSLAERARRPFSSEADSDPALAANRQWARDIAAAIPTSTRGVEAVRAGEQALSSSEAIDGLIKASAKAARDWQALTPEERAAALHRVGDVLAARRGELIEVAGSE